MGCVCGSRDRCPNASIPHQKRDSRSSEDSARVAQADRHQRIRREDSCIFDCSRLRLLQLEPIGGFSYFADLAASMWMCPSDSESMPSSRSPAGNLLDCNMYAKMAALSGLETWPGLSAGMEVWILSKRSPIVMPVQLERKSMPSSGGVCPLPCIFA